MRPVVLARAVIVAGAVAALSACSAGGPPSYLVAPTAELTSEPVAHADPQPAVTETPTPMETDDALAAPAASSSPEPSETVDPSVDHSPFTRVVGTVLTNSSTMTGEVDVWIPGYGEVSADMSTLLPGAHVTDSAIASTGSDDQRLVAVAVEEIRGTGLETPHEVVHLFTYSMAAHTWFDVPLVGDAFTGDDLQLANVIGSDTSVIAIGLTRADDPDDAGTQLLRVDSASGAVLSQTEVWGVSVFDAAVVVDTSPGCPVLSGLDVAEGTLLWTVKGADYPGTYDDCSSMGVTQLDGQAAPVEVSVQRLDDPLYFDAVSGAALSPALRDAEHYDGAQHLAFVDLNRASWLNDREDEGYAVIDATTGERLWSLDNETAGALDFRFEGLWDGELYASTVNGNVLVDVRTGDTSATWSEIPRGTVAGWLLWPDGTLERAEGD